MGRELLCIVEFPKETRNADELSSAGYPIDYGFIPDTSRPMATRSRPW
jgi:inorganic pyrophosphatase